MTARTARTWRLVFQGDAYTFDVTHPGGGPTPDAEDWHFTKRMKEAAGGVTMRRIVTRLVVALYLSLATAATVLAQGDCGDDPWGGTWQPNWQHAYSGIDWASACTTLLPSRPGVAGQRTQRVHALRIDMTNGDVHFFTTPHGGTSDTIGQVASLFACQYDVQAAINASFSEPCCTYEPPDHTPLDIAPNFVLWGLAVSDFKNVSPAALGRVPNRMWVGAASMTIRAREGGGNRAQFQTTIAGQDVPKEVSAAIAGGPQPSHGNPTDTGPVVPVPGEMLLLKDGVNLACKECDANPVETVAARTAVGVSGGGGVYLYMVTIDGVDGGNASRGASFYDTAEWLRVLGAADGMNLDGGGSTTMVMQMPGATNPDHWVYQIVNNPTQGECTQRYVGNFLGVKAGLLDEPTLPAPYCSTVVKQTQRVCSLPAARPRKH